MLSPTANVPPPAAPRLPGSTAPAMPSATATGVPSFSQVLSDQAEPPRPAPAEATPRPAEKPPAEAAAAPTKAASPTPRKEASVQRTTAASPRRTPASDAEAVPDTAAAGPAGRAGEDDSVTLSVDTAATDDRGADADDAIDAPEVSGLNEFTQLIGLPPPSAASAAALGLSRSADGARDVEPRTTAQRVGGTQKAAMPLSAAVDAAGAPDTPAVEASDTPSGGPASGPDSVGVEASAGLVSARHATNSPAEDAAARSSTESSRTGMDTDKPSRSSAHRATETGTSRETTTARASTADLSAKATQEQAQIASASQAAASSEPLPAARTVDNGPLNFSALMAQSLAPAMAGEPGSPPVSGRVHASVHSAAFAPELAAQVSLLAVDGVQTAQLQLNPTEMGPVTVQIVVDGGQAQVSFQAAQADTRQALEQSLPDLAAALQGQGLTLSGGGVFQQPPRDSNRADPDASEGNSRSRSAASGRVGGLEPVSAGATAAPARRAVGLLDTFA